MIITLCGSTKFKDEYLDIAKKLALQGHCVLSVNLFAHADNIELTTEEKIRLDNAHKQKISLSDAIYVINKNQYIGESTYGEIDWAERNGKQVYFLEELPKQEEKNTEKSEVVTEENAE